MAFVLWGRFCSTPYVCTTRRGTHVQRSGWADSPSHPFPQGSCCSGNVWQAISLKPAERSMLHYHRHVGKRQVNPFSRFLCLVGPRPHCPYLKVNVHLQKGKAGAGTNVNGTVATCGHAATDCDQTDNMAGQLAAVALT